MTVQSKSVFAIAAATICALSPAVASANSGWMTCQLHRDANPRTYYTYPFKADSADEDAMTAKFQKVSIESGMLNTTDTTLGGCHWEPSKDRAFAVAKAFMAKYPGNEFDFSRAMELATK